MPDPGPQRGEQLATLVEAVLTRPPCLGGTRLVCIDGPAGSGKTSLAARLEDGLTAAALTAAVVHMDDLYEGWGGLEAAEALVEEWLLEPLAAGREAAYRRYDWERGAYAESHPLPPVDVLLLEGVGSGCAAHEDRTTLLVWVDAPADLRLRRGLERDGSALEEHWRRWMDEEATFHQQDATRARADVLVDGTTGRITVRR